MNSITQIHVGGQLVGLVGLDDALEMVRELELAEDLVPDFLLHRVMEKNYVPQRAEEEYRKAVYRFYCRKVGLPMGEDASDGLVIRILGPGCSNCNRLEQELTAVLMELNLAADLVHIRDIKEIASYGVMGTPALVVNGKVVSVGTVPPRAKIKALLQEAFGKRVG